MLQKGFMLQRNKQCYAMSGP